MKGIPFEILKEVLSLIPFISDKPEDWRQAELENTYEKETRQWKTNISGSKNASLVVTLIFVKKTREWTLTYTYNSY